MYCDECAVEPAQIDHLDLTQGPARLRRLCARCAAAERKAWDRDRLVLPSVPGLAHEKDRRAA